MGILYIVATPIGNLEDLTFRALRILSEVDLILSEDTRVTKKLLDHYQIKTPTLSYHQYSKLQKTEYIINLLKEGKNLALVSDAGTPGISDPGNKIIHKILESTGGNPRQIKIIPIPGPSAVTAAVSVSGFPMDKFVFMGFPPAKKKRKKFFEEVVIVKYPVIFYESPHRIIKTLEELRNSIICHDRISKLQVVVCRELTKKFETIYRGKIAEVVKKIEKDKIKGEFVVIVGKQ